MDKKTLLYGRFVIVMIAALCVLNGVMYVIYPLCGDDTWFLAFSTGERGSWEHFVTTVANCYDHWQYDTGRLSNMSAAPFLSLLPIWVYGALTSVMIFLIYVGGIRLSRCSLDSVGAALWIAVVSFALPWFEYMFTIMYSINYMWGAALGLTLFCLYLRDDTDEAFRPSLKTAALFALAFVTGWWHEGLSVPLLAALLCHMALERRRPSARRIVIAAGLALGIATIIAMPAFWCMTQARVSHLLKSTLWESLVQLLLFNCFFYLLVITVVGLMATRRWRRVVSDVRDRRFVAASLVFGLVATAIYIKYYNGARTGFFSQLVCAAALLRVWRHAVGHAGSLFGRAAVAVVLTAAIASAGYALAVQRRLTVEVETVRAQAEAEMARTGRPTAFFDQTPIRVGLDFLKPSYIVLNTHAGMGDIRLFPSDLRDFSFGNPEVRRCASSPALYIYRNRLLYRGPAPDENRERFDVVLTDASGRETRSRTRIRDFIDRDGDTVSFVLPHSQTLDPGLTVTDARFEGQPPAGCHER